MVASRSCVDGARSLACVALVGLLWPASAVAAGTQTQLAALLQAPLAGAERGQTIEPAASRRSGDESALRIVSELEEPGTLPGLRAHARLGLELPLEQLTHAALGLRDLSSHVGVAWAGEGATLTLRSFPFDTDYLRLGQLRWLSWGGTDTARGESIFVDQEGGAPGVELSLELPAVRLFAACKWTSQAQQARRVGGLFGGTFKPRAWLRLDAGFGYFERAPAAVGLPASFAEGASLRLVVGGAALEPDLAAEPFRPPSLRSEMEAFQEPASRGASLALEVVTVAQRVRRAGDVARFEVVPAPGAALYGSARGAIVAAHAAVGWRSAELLLLGSHGLIAGEGLPRGASFGELSSWLGLSAELLPLSLTPSLQVAAQLPAALQLPSSVPGAAQTLLVRSGAQVEALPLGAGRLPVINVRAGARFAASRSVSLSLFLDYEHDSNRVGWRSTAVGPARSFVEPDGVTLTAASWARF